MPANISAKRKIYSERREAVARLIFFITKSTIIIIFCEDIVENYCYVFYRKYNKKHKTMYFQVVVLDAEDPSTKDREPPRFLQPMADESIVMEGHSYELQARLAGTPPFTVLWLKDGHEVVDSDYYRHVVYEDGGVALRFLNIHPLDAGEYTCVVRNEHGEATCRGLFIVQGMHCIIFSSFIQAFTFFVLIKLIFHRLQECIIEFDAKFCKDTGTRFRGQG